MGGHPLIQVEDLVGLRTAGRSVTRQVLKAAPLTLVRCDERVEIHVHTVFADDRPLPRPDTLGRS